MRRTLNYLLKNGGEGKFVGVWVINIYVHAEPGPRRELLANLDVFYDK